MSNNNQTLIDGLRKAAEYFEARPDLPLFGRQRIMSFADNRDQLKATARQMGELTKEFTGYYFTITHHINEAVVIEMNIDREQVCRKEIVWHCPDDESLLRLVEGSGSE